MRNSLLKKIINSGSPQSNRNKLRRSLFTLWGVLDNKWLAFGALLTIPLLGMMYGYLNHPGSGAYNLVTDLDRQLPFVKAFVLPYLAWYPFLLAALVYLLWKDRKLFYQTLAQYNLGLLVCYGVYALYQTTVPRPVLTGSDWLTQLVQSVYASDQPFNCFPSIHVLTTYVIMRAYLSASDIPRLYTGIVTFIGLLIIASTQLIKQHVLLDIVGAVLAAEGIKLLVSGVSGVWIRKRITE